MEEQTFEVRNTEFDKTTLYRLDGEALSWSNGKSGGRIACRDIAAVHLMVFDSNYGRGRLCRVRSKSGGRKTFRSLHCHGLGNLEDRSAAYGPFVRALMRRVAELAPDAKCTRGSLFDYIALIVGLIMLVGSGSIVLLAAFGAGLEPDPALLGFLAFVVATLPVVVGLMKRRRPRPFDPADPPPELIGDEAADIG